MVNTIGEKAKERAEQREQDAQKKKKLLIFAAIGLVAVAGLWTVFGSDSGNRPAVGDAEGSGGEEKMVEGVAISHLLGQTREEEPRLTREEEVRATIAQHEEEVEANPDDEMSPSKLNAAGNLHKQLGEAGEAARLYEILLADYPDWEGRRRVYPNLIACYQSLEQEEDLRRICREMMEFYPVDSTEYAWARDRLGLTPLTQEEIDAAVAEADAAAGIVEPE